MLSDRNYRKKLNKENGKKLSISLTRGDWCRVMRSLRDSNCYREEIDMKAISKNSKWYKREKKNYQNTIRVHDKIADKFYEKYRKKSKYNVKTFR